MPRNVKASWEFHLPADIPIQAILEAWRNVIPQYPMTPDTDPEIFDLSNLNSAAEVELRTFSIIRKQFDLSKMCSLTVIQQPDNCLVSIVTSGDCFTENFVESLYNQIALQKNQSLPNLPIQSCHQSDSAYNKNYSGGSDVSRGQGYLLSFNLPKSHCQHLLQLSESEYRSFLLGGVAVTHWAQACVSDDFTAVSRDDTFQSVNFIANLTPSTTIADLQLSLRTSTHHGSTGNNNLTNYKVEFSRFCGRCFPNIAGHPMEFYFVKRQNQNSVQLIARYDCSMYNSFEVNCFVQILTRILQFAINNPHMNVQSIASRFTPWFNKKQVSTVSLLEQFESTAARNPESIAIEESGLGQCSYSALNTRAEILAPKLSAISSTNQFVAVLLPQSTLNLATIIAILKLGKVFVPLGPNDPRERHLSILQDLNYPVLVTSELLMVKVEGYPHICVVDTQKDNFTTQPQPRHLPAKRDELMYCIYTSGSTGLPKGVLVDHSSVAAWTAWNIFEFDIQNCDRGLLYSSPAFDMSVGETWPYLVTGGTLIIPPSDLRGDIVGLRDWVAEQKITMLSLTTSFAKHFILEKSGNSNSIRWIQFGGESSVSLVNKRLETGFGAAHCYGLSELTITQACRKFQPEDTLTSSVGKGIPGFKVKVEECDGQIHVEMPIPPPGYHNRLELNQLLITYRENGNYFQFATGDLGTIRPDGELEVIGRLDSQVKVRGFRLELQEIELALLGHPAVYEAAAVLDGDVIRGFATLQKNKCQNQDLNVSDCALLTFLATRLPPQALPTTLAILSNFPLTTNGKLDQKELLKISRSRKASSNMEIMTETEAKMATLWEEILKLPPNSVNKDSNFFQLGGHSVLAAGLVHLAKRWRWEMAVAQIYTHVSLQELAMALEMAGTSPCITDIKRSPGLDTESRGQLPLSFAQEQLWLYASELDEDSETLVVTRCLRFVKVISISRLQLALDLVVKNHDVLRVAISIQEHEPYQKFESSRPVVIHQFDTHKTLKFDILVGNLIQFYLQGEKELLVVYHHMLMDGPGWALFKEALDTAYNGWGLKETADYSASVILERNQLHSSQSVKHWKEVLNGMVPLEIPRLAVVNPKVHEGASGSTTHLNHIQRLVLSNCLSEWLRILAKEEKSTLFVVLLAIFKTLLVRTGLGTDVTILTLLRNPNLPQMLLGHFVNLVPIRTKINPDQTFLHLVRTIHANFGLSMTHADLPFQKFGKECGMELETKRELLRIMVQLRVQPTPPLTSFAEDTTHQVSRESTVDLGLDFEDLGQGSPIMLELEHNSYLFDAERMSYFLQQFELLSQNLVHTPNLPIRSLQVSNFPDFNSFHVNSNTKAQSSSLLDQFRARVSISPNATAIIQESGRILTYSDLDDWSNQILELLTSKLASRGHNLDFIATLLGPGSVFIAASLAVLKFGATLAPLSLTYPSNYMNHIIEDLGHPPILTTHQDLTESSYLGHLDLEVIILDEFQKQNRREATSNKAQQASVLSHCFFTSGTTGIPKGVLLKEPSVVNAIQNYVDRMGLTSKDTSFTFHNPAFDASLVDYWPVLLSGGTVLSTPRHLLYDPSALLDWTMQNGVTILHLPTAVAEDIFVSGKTNIDPIRWIIVGGEKIKVGPPDSFPPCINAYGPTETTLDATQEIVTSKSLHSESVGYPVPQAKVYVLDAWITPCPVNVVGDIWVGGNGVGQGYLNRPLLNEMAFRSNPFDNGRIFRTGDVGCWLPAGRLQLRGRSGLSQQVKLNGFRIELDEVEFALRKHPQMSRVRVLALENSSRQGPTLIAFAIGQKSTILKPSLEYFLNSILPYYAWPSRIIWIESFPLNNSGKVDLRKLRILAQEVHLSDDAKEIANDNATLTNNEKLLAEIWAELLNLSESDLHRNSHFFSVGGTSLHAGALISKIQLLRVHTESTENRLTFHEVFKNPRLCQMALLIDKGLNFGRQESLASDSEVNLWLRQQMLGPENYAYIAYASFDLGTSISDFTRDISKLLQNSESVRRVFKLEGGYLRAYIIPATDLAVLHASKEESGTCAEKMLEEPVDLSKPLLQMFIFNANDESKFTLHFKWHTIIQDSTVSFLDTVVDYFGLTSASSKYLDIKMPHIAKTHVVHCDISKGIMNLTKQDIISAVMQATYTNCVFLLPTGEIVSKLQNGNYSWSPKTFPTVFISISEDSMNEKTIKCSQNLIGRPDFQLYFKFRIFKNAAKSIGSIEIYYDSTNCSSDCVQDLTHIVLSMLNGEKPTSVELFERQSQILPPLVAVPVPTTNAHLHTHARTWEKLISRQWSLERKLPIRSISRTSDFFESLNGSTFEMIRAADATCQLLENPPNFKHFFEHSSVSSLAATLPESLLGFDLELDAESLSAQLQEFASIHRGPPSYRKDQLVALVTGCAGYVGLELVASLLQDAQFQHVFCLLRTSSGKLQHFKSYFEPNLLQRLTILECDMGDPYLGLSYTLYNDLVQNVDIIYHCAAEVSLVKNYMQLRRTNVLGTFHILKLALSSTARPKSVHYLSTLDFAVGQHLFDTEDRVMDEELPCPPPYFELGYYQTKWVAEALISAASQWLTCKIYRLGTVGAHSKLDIVNRDSFDSTFLRTCVLLGAFPMLKGFSVPYTALDFTAGAIRVISKKSASKSTWPVINVLQRNVRYEKIFEQWNVRPMESSAWFKILREYVAQAPTGKDDSCRGPAQTFLLLVEQKLWVNGAIGNMFEYLQHMPRLAYPNKKVMELLKNSEEGEELLQEPDVQRYVNMIT